MVIKNYSCAHDEALYTGPHRISIVVSLICMCNYEIIMHIRDSWELVPIARDYPYVDHKIGPENRSVELGIDERQGESEIFPCRPSNRTRVLAKDGSECKGQNRAWVPPSPTGPLHSWLGLPRVGVCLSFLCLARVCPQALFSLRFHI